VATLAERLQTNAATFRRANHGIAAFARRLHDDERLIPFMCECLDDDCARIIRMSLREYALVELFSNQYAVAVECYDARDGLEIARTDRYVVVDRLRLGR
jgi:hypothetical protein